MNRKTIVVILVAFTAGALTAFAILSMSPRNSTPNADGQGISAEYMLYPLAEPQTFEGITIQYIGYGRVENYYQFWIRRIYNSTYFTDGSYSEHYGSITTIRIDYLELEVKYVDNTILRFVIKAVHR